ncbi:MAG: hypothetical protein QXX01_03380 [Candidatus Aenigmatarchaeota archaeon]
MKGKNIEKLSEEYKKQKWIAATLSNDETSTDEELVNYFMREGEMSKEEASFYVKQRNRFLQDFTAELIPYNKEELETIED